MGRRAASPGAPRAQRFRNPLGRPFIRAGASVRPSIRNAAGTNRLSVSRPCPRAASASGREPRRAPSSVKLNLSPRAGSPRLRQCQDRPPSETATPRGCAPRRVPSAPRKCAHSGPPRSRRCRANWKDPGPAEARMWEWEVAWRSALPPPRDMQSHTLTLETRDPRPQSDREPQDGPRN